MAEHESGTALPELPREVLLDLLPAYASGEASAATRALVAAHPATDPEPARRPRRGGGRAGGGGGGASRRAGAASAPTHARGVERPTLALRARDHVHGALAHEPDRVRRRRDQAFQPADLRLPVPVRHLPGARRRVLDRLRRRAQEARGRRVVRRGLLATRRGDAAGTRPDCGEPPGGAAKAPPGGGGHRETGAGRFTAAGGRESTTLKL